MLGPYDLDFYRAHIDADILAPFQERYPDDPDKWPIGLIVNLQLLRTTKLLLAQTPPPARPRGSTQD